MESNDLSKQIDENTDELLILVKHHVEEVLYKFYLSNGIKAGYDVRDNAISYVYNLAIKKGTHDTKFQELRGQYIHFMVKNYLLKILG